MDKTDEFLKEHLYINKINNKGKEIKVRNTVKLAEICLEKINAGYDMLLVEACDILDVEADWLMNNFSHKFDFFRVSVDVSNFIFPANFEKEVELSLKHKDLVDSRNDLIKSFHARFNIEPPKLKKALRLKKIYIDRESFYNFLLNDLKISHSKIAITIDKKDVNDCSMHLLAQLKNEFLLKKGIIKYDEFTKRFKDVSEQANGVLEDLTLDVFEKVIGNHLISPANLKRNLLGGARSSNHLYSLNDEQMYRYLDKETHVKLALKQDNKTRLVVRYLIDDDLVDNYVRSIDEEDSKSYTFTISSKFNDEVEVIKREFIQYVLDSFKEEASK